MKTNEEDFWYEFNLWLIKSKTTLTFWLMFLVTTLSILTIVFVVYFYFFWEPPILCDVKDGYWGFKATCDYWNWEIVDKHHYVTLEQCQEAIQRWSSGEDCKVVR